MIEWKTVSFEFGGQRARECRIILAQVIWLLSAVSNQVPKKGGGGFIVSARRNQQHQDHILDVLELTKVITQKTLIRKASKILQSCQGKFRKMGFFCGFLLIFFDWCIM